MGNLLVQLRNIKQLPTAEQKDLGLKITLNLTWNENCESRGYWILNSDLDYTERLLKLN